jgi:ADP-heptose:LPS heptosyltransferase
MNERILLILPCCIGDVVMATATLRALRRGFPQAHITWAVGGWARRAIEGHPDLNAVLDTGPDDLPVRTPASMMRFVRQIRAGRYTHLVSLVRSPLMSVAAMLTGIPIRVGLDSDGRGFGYTIRIPINPNEARLEGDIYLETAAALGLDINDCWANLPLSATQEMNLQTLRAQHGIDERYLVIHPGGGSNPGMEMDLKRWPPAWFAQVGAALTSHLHAQLVLIGGPNDMPLIDEVKKGLPATVPFVTLPPLTFSQVAILAAEALIYVGNDTGMTHLAAASGAHTVAIFGPSDPQRYAPFVPGTLVLWEPTLVPANGVASGAVSEWTWNEDGIGPEEALEQIGWYMERTGISSYSSSQPPLEG